MDVWDAAHQVAPFAFRVLDEITEYIEEADELEVGWEEALDEQLLQKVLPKIKGTDLRLGVALRAFADRGRPVPVDPHEGQRDARRFRSMASPPTSDPAVSQLSSRPEGDGRPPTIRFLDLRGA